MAKRRRVPVMPGPAYYDPALLENLRQSRRELGRLRVDVGPGGTQPSRLASQFGLQQSEYGRGKRELGEDYSTSLSNILTQRGYTQADYGTNLADLQRNFQRLGSAQTQQARSAGVAAGGALEQATRKRATNQAIARAPIDTGFARAMAASRADQAGLERQRARGQSALDRALAAQGTSYLTDVADLGTQLRRAETDQKFFEQASKKAIYHQAAAAGWVPPKGRRGKGKGKGKGKGGGR